MISAPGLVIGPIFSRELVMASRRPRTVIIQTCFVLGLSCVVLLAWPPPYASHDVVLSAGRTAFVVLAWLAWLAVALLAPASTANAITSEKERNSLGLLMMAETSSTEIITGKLGSRLVLIFILLILSTPVLIALQSLGGVGLDEIIALSCHLAALACYGCSLGMLFSVIMRTDVSALLAALGGLAAHLATTAGTCRWLGASPELTLTVSPLDGFLHLLDPTSLAPQLPFSVWIWGRSAALLVAASVGIVALTSLLLPHTASIERFLSRRGFWERQQADSQLQAAARRGQNPRAGRNPIAWYESGHGSPRFRQLLLGRGALLTAALVGVWLLLADHLHDIGLQQAIVTTLLALLQLTATVIAATSVTRERERSTLEILATTPVDGETYVVGKVAGIAYTCGALFLLPILHVAVFVASGTLLWHSLISITIGASMLGLGAIMQGLFISMLTATSLRASLTALGITGLEMVLSVCCCVSTMNPYLIAKFGVVPMSSSLDIPPVYYLVALVFSAGVHLGFTLVLYSLATSEFDHCIGRIP